MVLVQRNDREIPNGYNGPFGIEWLDYKVGADAFEPGRIQIAFGRNNNGPKLNTFCTEFHLDIVTFFLGSL